MKTTASKKFCYELVILNKVQSPTNLFSVEPYNFRYNNLTLVV